MQSPPNLHLSSAKIHRPLANAMYMSEVYELKPLKSIVFVISADSNAACAVAGDGAACERQAV